MKQIIVKREINEVEHQAAVNGTPENWQELVALVESSEDYQQPAFTLFLSAFEAKVKGQIFENSKDGIETDTVEFEDTLAGITEGRATMKARQERLEVFRTEAVAQLAELAGDIDNIMNNATLMGELSAKVKALTVQIADLAKAREERGEKMAETRKTKAAAKDKYNKK